MKKTIAAVLTAAAIATGGLAATANAARADGPIRVAVAGDSLTAFEDSWWADLKSTDPGVIDAGGLAVKGATSWYIQSNIQPANADVLVIMLGTNDVRHGVPVAGLDQHLEAIAGKVGARHVLLAYLPPSDDTVEMISGTAIDCRNKNLVYSRELVSLALRHGWLVADPWAPWRSYSGAYAGGATDDGVHPTADVFAQIAPRMGAYIRQAYLAGQP